jgi:hypothetical protein
MLKTTLKFENHGSSGLHYIGHGVKFEVPGHAIGNSGVSVNVDADQATAITEKVQSLRPAIAVTSIRTFDDGVAQDYIPMDKTPVNAVAASGTLTVTAGGSNIANNDTVTIGSKVYTFKTALTPAEGEVLIGANDTAALLNLKNAINHEGTAGTDYSCAAAHSTVSATSSNATTLVIAAKTKGAAGNDIASTETGANMSWGAAHLAGGVNGTPGAANEICVDGSYLYHAVAGNSISDANWRRVSLGAVY